MQRRQRSRIVATSILFGIMLLHSSRGQRIDARGDQASSVTLPQAATFGRDLEAQLGSEGNLCFSPLSVLSCLRIAYAGARGTTASELRHFVPDDREKIWQQVLAQGRSKNDAGIRLTVANAVWVDSDLDVAQAFQNHMKANLGTHFAKIAFSKSPDRAARIINDWVGGETAGAIPQLYPSGKDFEPGTRFLITSAVSFQAAWAEPFKTLSTKEENFALSPQSRKKVRMMHSFGKFSFAEDAGAKLLEIPYADPRFAMRLILPNAGQSIGKAEARLFDFASAKLSTETVKLTLPRFSIRQRIDLRGPLTRLGLETPFVAGKADFTGVTGGARNDLFLSALVQQSYIEVDETGSRAAAVSGASAEITSAISIPQFKTFQADRPFAFAIIDQQLQLILFSGRVVDPSKCK